MSEKTDAQRRVDDLLSGKTKPPDEIAAAEERGRRRGVEEAAKLVEQLRAESRGTVIVPYAAARIRALAPRDSGKEG